MFGFGNEQPIGYLNVSASHHANNTSHHANNKSHYGFNTPPVTPTTKLKSGNLKNITFPSINKS